MKYLGQGLHLVGDSTSVTPASGDNSTKIATTAFVKNADFKTYAGFENRVDSTISINGTGLFTLAPTSSSFNVYLNGQGKINLTNTQTSQITADQTITYLFLSAFEQFRREEDVTRLINKKIIANSLTY
jgi:uncharacterized surface protein with fasciclin (FAS1) repeats